MGFTHPKHQTYQATAPAAAMTHRGVSPHARLPPMSPKAKVSNSVPAAKNAIAITQAPRGPKDRCPAMVTTLIQATP